MLRITCNHHYRVFGSSEVVVPFLESLDEGEELPTIDVVVLLGRRKGGRVVSTRMEVPVGVFLHEYSSGGSKGGIGHDEKWLGGVQHFDHWCRQESFLEFNESIVLFFPPVEGYPLHG